jgi:hypothetical protein
MSKSTIFMFVVLSSTIAAITGSSHPALAVADASQQETEDLQRCLMQSMEMPAPQINSSESALSQGLSAAARRYSLRCFFGSGGERLSAGNALGSVQLKNDRPILELRILPEEGRVQLQMFHVRL